MYNSFLLSIGIHIHIPLYELVSVVPRLFIEYIYIYIYTAVARALPLGGGGGDLQICRENVEFTRVSDAAENDGTKCRRQTAGGPGGRCTAPGKFWNLTLLEGLKSLFQQRI